MSCLAANQGFYVCTFLLYSSVVGCGELGGDWGIIFYGGDGSPW